MLTAKSYDLIPQPNLVKKTSWKILMPLIKLLQERFSNTDNHIP